MASRATPAQARLPVEPPEVDAAAAATVRAASLAERGRMVAQAVRAAMRIDRSRRAAGLPEPVPEPWPSSTREFLRVHAAACRSRVADPPHASRG